MIPEDMNDIRKQANRTMTMVAIIMIGTLVFWAAVIFVALHFIAKLW
jgi:hypothetical protein